VLVDGEGEVEKNRKRKKVLTHYVLWRVVRAMQRLTEIMYGRTLMRHSTVWGGLKTILLERKKKKKEKKKKKKKKKQKNKKARKKTTKKSPHRNNSMTQKK